MPDSVSWYDGSVFFGFDHVLGIDESSEVYVGSYRIDGDVSLVWWARGEWGKAIQEHECFTLTGRGGGEFCDLVLPGESFETNFVPTILIEV